VLRLYYVRNAIATIHSCRPIPSRVEVRTSQVPLRVWFEVGGQLLARREEFLLVDDVVPKAATSSDTRRPLHGLAVYSTCTRQ